MEDILVNIPLSKVVPNPDQPRKTFNEETILELANSIKERGLIEPIVVRPKGNKYEIIAGERRHRAAEKAGLKEIPALIRKASKSEALIDSLIENTHREDLNPIDRAESFRGLKKILGISWEKLASRVGLTKRHVLRLVSLLDLPKEIQEDIRSKSLTARHGRALRKLKDNKDEMIEVSEKVKDDHLSSGQAERLAGKTRIRHPFGDMKALEEKMEREEAEEKRKKLTGDFLEKSRNYLKDADSVKSLNFIEILPEEEISELKENLKSINFKVKNIIKRLNF